MLLATDQARQTDSDRANNGESAISAALTACPTPFYVMSPGCPVYSPSPQWSAYSYMHEEKFMSHWEKIIFHYVKLIPIGKYYIPYSTE